MNTMRYMAILFAVSALSALLAGCMREELIEEEPQACEECPIVGEYVNADITVSVEDIRTGLSTRAGEEVPSDDPVDDTEAERKVDCIWVFQFDASSLAIVNGGAKKIEITDQSDLQHLPTENVLVTNDYSPSIVYIVANVGTADWISVSAGFTLNDLLAATIPNPEPIFTDEAGDPASTIPMGGQTESSVVVTDHARIIVPIYRMFAKLMIKTGVDFDAETSDIKVADVKAVDVGKVPNKCTVGTLYKDESTQAYPDGVEFQPWSFTFDGAVDPDTYYVVYVPENISGISSNTLEGNKAEDAPANALKITAHLDLRDSENAVIKADPQYTVYPGGNIIDNFNVRRNCVYRITTEINPSNVISPSANSLVAAPGELIAFYPYVRDEVGHRSDAEDGGVDNEKETYYNFENHLTWGETEDDDALRIASVKIIWQTENCIGDNSQEPYKVQLVDNGEATKIYVQTSAVGNALIAAYAKDGETILWSWHIWVTSDAPDNVDNAVTYYHYKWDTAENGGIDTSTREIGYPLMDCNLGALSRDTGDTWDEQTLTFGLLYQWGRKDPFPPTKYYGDYSSVYPDKTHRMYDYDEAVAHVIVYDNAHNKINMVGNTGTVYSSGYLFNTVRGDGIGASNDEAGIDYSVKHPTTFIAGADFTSNGMSDGAGTYYNNVSYYINQGDWLVDRDDDLWGGDGTAGTTGTEKRLQVYSIDNGDSIDASLEDNYGKHKTIFDPCPYGWRVSPGDLWLGFTIDGKNYNSNTVGTTETMHNYVNCREETVADVADNLGFHMYVTGWHDGGRTTFFPTQGSRLANGRPFYGGVCGNYHNATVDEVVDVVDVNGTQRNAIRRVDIIHFHSSPYDVAVGSYYYTQVQPFETQLCYFNRAVAGPVRCVRDTER